MNNDYPGTFYGMGIVIGSSFDYIDWLKTNKNMIDPQKYPFSRLYPFLLLFINNSTFYLIYSFNSKSYTL